MGADSHEERSRKRGQSHNHAVTRIKQLNLKALQKMDCSTQVSCPGSDPADALSQPQQCEETVVPNHVAAAAIEPEGGQTAPNPAVALRRPASATELRNIHSAPSSKPLEAAVANTCTRYVLSNVPCLGPDAEADLKRPAN